VAGLVLTLLGRPARVGDSVMLNEVRMQVEAVHGLAVQLVRVVRPQTAPSGRAHES
jgi:CBS domain containing-hemolysin-like protein